jgi:hypothetical protein
MAPHSHILNGTVLSEVRSVGLTSFVMLADPLGQPQPSAGKECRHGSESLRRKFCEGYSRMICSSGLHPYLLTNSDSP